MDISRNLLFSERPSSPRIIALRRKKTLPVMEMMMLPPSSGPDDEKPAYHVVDVPDRTDDLQSNQESSDETNHADDDGVGSRPQAAMDNVREDEEIRQKMIRDAKAQYENVRMIVKQKNSESLRDFGGSRGIADALYTNIENGIPEEEILSRCFGTPKSVSQGPLKQMAKIVFNSCNDYNIFLLILYVVLVGGFGMGMKGLRTGWYESLVIFIAIIILVALRSASEFWRLRNQQEMVKKKGENLKVRVIRGGVETRISMSELVAGDMVLLKRGDVIPADGLFVSGPFVALDDEQLLVDEETNPFLFYGGKVINGHGRMLVVSVGGDGVFSEMMGGVMTNSRNTEKVSPFQHQLNQVIKVTQTLGILISIVVLVALFLHFKLANHKPGSDTPNVKDKPTSMDAVLKILKRLIEGQKEKVSVMTMVTVSMLGMAEGLPLFIALAIRYWKKKKLSGASIRDLLASVTMGSVDTVCIDKTGLALYQWQVDTFFVGDKAINDDFEVASNVLDSIAEGIMATQTQTTDSSVEEDPVLIFWAESKFGLGMEKVKQGLTIIKAEVLEWSEGRSAVLIKKKKLENVDQTHQIWHYRAGAKETLEKCRYFYDPSSGEKKNLDESKRKYLEQSIDQMESNGLKLIAFANKQDEDEDEDLVLVGLLGLKKTCCKQTVEAIKECKNGGIRIVLLTQDSLLQAEEMALRYGIIDENSIDELVIDAEDFDKYNHEQRICVLANCLPRHKLVFLKTLKEKKQITAMMIFSISNIPAMKVADVGIALDSHSATLAKDSADIIIKGCYFSCLVSIISYGRSILFNTQKQIQVEITVLVSGMLITLIASSISSISPISGIQLAWVCFLVAIVAGLGHFTDSSGEKPLKKTPEKQNYSLLTKGMVLNIALHVTYQVVVLLVFRFKLEKAIGMDRAGKTFIFNSFFLCQIFNFLAREVEKIKMLKDIIQKQKLLWLAAVAALFFQWIFIKVAAILDSPSLSLPQWLVCFVVGILPFFVDCGAMIVKRKLNDPTATQSNLETPLMRGSPSPVISIQ